MTAPAIDLAPTAEQDELRSSVRRLFAERGTETDVRRVMATDAAFDSDVWASLVAIGVPGLTIPEEYGGAGYGVAELAVVLEEAGRAVAPVPLLSSVALASTALLASGDAGACGRLLPALAAGERRATLAVPAGTDQLLMDQGLLHGSVALVLDGHTADDVLVVVDDAQGRSLFHVEAGAARLGRTKVATLDQTRPMATLDFDGVAATLIGSPGGAAEAVERALAVGRVALACEAVGGGDAVLAAAVGYAKERRQFGRLIGSFQAVKHLCADMLVELEPGRAAAAYAARVADTGDAAELRIASAVAKSWCTEAFAHAASTNIQVHGGIGFTWEHPAHLYLKRAKTNQVLLGDGRQQRAALAAALGLVPG